MTHPIAALSGLAILTLGMVSALLLLGHI